MAAHQKRRGSGYFISRHRSIEQIASGEVAPGIDLALAKFVADRSARHVMADRDPDPQTIRDVGAGATKRIECHPLMRL